MPALLVTFQEELNDGLRGLVGSPASRLQCPQSVTCARHAAWLPLALPIGFRVGAQVCLSVLHLARMRDKSTEKPRSFAKLNATTGTAW